MIKPRLRLVTASLLDLDLQRAFLQHRIVKAIFLTVSIVLIVSQQTSFLLRTEDPDTYYRNVLNLGASYQRYFAFFYYFGGFLVNLDRQKTSTIVEARATLTELGSKLVPDRSVYNRASIFFSCFTLMRI